MSFFVASPIILASFPLFAGAVWYMYRAKGDANIRKVSTIEILKRFKSELILKKKRHYPIRLFLELFFLLLLFFLASKVTLVNSSENVLIIFDDSLSTHRIVGDNFNLHQKLVDATKNFFDNLSINAKVDIIDSLSDEKKENITSEDLNQIIYANNAAHRDNFADKLSKISFLKYQRIFVASDRLLKITPYNGIIENAISIEDLPKGNIYFSEANYRANTNSTIIDGALISTAPIIGSSVSVIAVNKKGEQIGVFQGVFSESARLPFAISFKGEKLGFIRLNLQTDIDAANSIKVDSIKDDNSIDLEDGSDEKIQLIGANKSRLHLPSTISSRIIEDTDIIKDKRIIFTKSIEKVSANSIFQVDGEYALGRISRWDEGNEVLRYVNFSLRSEVPFTEVSCINGTSPILWIEGKEALCQGVISGYRVIISGLALFPFNNEQVSPRNVITLNSINWVFGISKVVANSLESESSLTEKNLSIVSSNKFIQETDSLSNFSKKIIVLVLILIMVIDLIFALKNHRFYGRV